MVVPATNALRTPRSARSVPDGVVLEELTLASSAASIATARELLLEYGRFVTAQSEVAGFCFGGLQEEARQLPLSYLNQRGGAILAGQNSQLNSFQPHALRLGFIAWRSLSSPRLAHAFEIKRLWVRPQARGLGLGRILMAAVFERARALGKQELLLDTVPAAMASAYRLYCDLGFVESPSYQDHSTPGVVYMRKQL